MDVTAALIVTTAIFAWGVVSARLQRADLTAPIVFVAVGVAAGRAGASSTLPRARRA